MQTLAIGGKSYLKFSMIKIFRNTFYIYKGRWDMSLMGKNVSVMSGNEHDQHAETPQRKFAGTVNFIPDVKIKSLKYTNLLKNPVFTGSKYIPGVWSEKKN